MGDIEKAADTGWHRGTRLPGSLRTSVWKPQGMLSFWGTLHGCGSGRGVRASREIGFYVESVDGWEGTQPLCMGCSGDFVESGRTPLSPVSLVLRGKVMGWEEEASLSSGICETEQLTVALIHALPSFWPSFTWGSWRDSVLQFQSIRGDFSRKRVVWMLRGQKWMSNGTFFLIFKFIFTFYLWMRKVYRFI